jgi:hypothetical protein
MRRSCRIRFGVGLVLAAAIPRLWAQNPGERKVGQITPGFPQL